MSLRFEDTHTLRGPRQAGKTTTLKRFIKRLADAGERRILYFSFDTVRRSGAVGDVIRLAKRLHPFPDGPWYIFLDEITSVPEWEHDIKRCWDSGLTRDDALVLTASSAPGQSLEPKKQRKVYMIDPLYAELPHTLIPGTAHPDSDGMVENLVAVALFRSAALTLTQANAIPGTVGYWRSRDGREIDFVVPRVTDLENPHRFPVEVKGDNSTGISNARLAIKRSFQHGVVVSRSRFDWASDVAVLPVWMVLAGLRENLYRPVTFG
jgi:predicted AAA+ superfamily ATPase